MLAAPSGIGPESLLAAILLQLFLCHNEWPNRVSVILCITVSVK